MELPSIKFQEIIDDLLEGARVTWRSPSGSISEYLSGPPNKKGTWISITQALSYIPGLQVIKIDITGTKLQKMLDERFK